MKTKIFSCLFLVVFFVQFCTKEEQHKHKDKEENLQNYREFTHIKTLTLEEGHPLYKDFGGIHHIYANKIATQAYKNKTNFPEGSLIVFDLMEAVRKDNAVSEGKRKVLAYMKKISNKRTTGNWEFQAYLEGDLNKPIVTDEVKQCFACHQSQERKDYVFSEWRQ